MSLVNQLLGRASPGKALRRAVSLAEEGRVGEAFPLFAQAARAGLAEAEYRVARCYLEGAGVPANRAEGARWLRRAAANGWTDAQVLLATLCVHGMVDARNGEGGAPQGSRLFAAAAASTAPDFETALKWARLAADSGSPTGQAILGYILTYGPEDMRDLDAAHGLYQRSAAAGCPEGCLGYAISLARSATGAEAHREVADLLRRAAEAGLATAIYLLGVLTEQGLGVRRDPAVALQLFCHAAERGHRTAQTRWGLALVAGRDVPRDMVQGETWLRRAAHAGDADAAAAVGDLCIRNGMLPPNYAEAATWFLRAAEAGHKMAARALGTLYLTGAGVAQDSAAAARWLRVSAEAGDGSSHVDLGNLVLRGVGGPEDSVRIAQWFDQAAATGDAVAAFNLGLCHAMGVGVSRDEKKAAEWLRRAAESVPQAQFLYGRMLAEGWGVAADVAEARKWVTRAAESGLADAEVALGEMLVNGRGGPSDVAAALRLFQTAAEKEHSGAMYALGALYHGGHGLAVDDVAADRWFRAAAERGHGPAKLFLDRRTGSVAPDAGEEVRDLLERAAADPSAEDAASPDTGTAPPVIPQPVASPPSSRL